eukprot:CAMPEP_0115056158 /NCGR_PEP_ID=MMETSP0227-20121206/5037_1 /TAXON_ID=89957 /ORGANISM="Polarella glacialis, Strain CCMP 1383" /LENGTH=107 /DNA_ID=CAMNT_0002440799 /DNA_START=243 /DNA_END=563 /DNA_ORIENTATION=+
MGEPIRWLLQSAIHLIVLPVVALGVFYSGYRGLAEPDSSLAWRFKVGQPILAFAYLLLGTVPWGSVNGLAKLGSTNGSVYWLVVFGGSQFCGIRQVRLLWREYGITR